MLPSEQGAHFVLMFVDCYTLPHFLRFAGGRAVCVWWRGLGESPFSLLLFWLGKATGGSALFLIPPSLPQHTRSHTRYMKRKEGRRAKEMGGKEREG